MRRYKIMDGNEAAAYISYAFTEIAAIYPITPSSQMAELIEKWSVANRKNIFGQPVQVDELQSEAGAAATIHGTLKTGVLSTTYTSSQGLLLMLPNMYKMAGELLPAVFHVASRSVATSALSIFGDHSDVMAARSTGFAMIASGSVQEVMDLAPIAHLSAIDGSVPFIHFFDGFRTSHELQKISIIDYYDLSKIFPYEKYYQFKERKLNPNHPTISGTAQNSDLHFQQRELVNNYYNNLPVIVKKYMNLINDIQGTDYDLINYYGSPNAKKIIIAMGSVTETIKQTVDYLNLQGEDVGMMNVHLYRPFPSETLLRLLPDTVEKIAVLDRTKEPGSEGEPLLEDVKSALYNCVNRPAVIGGRYGIASKEVTPDQIIAIYNEMDKNLEELKTEFTVGINDDITNYSLEKTKILDLTSKNTYQALFYGYGSDGTVSGVKQLIKILGQHKESNIQGYFVYDSKKSGGSTVSHLRISDHDINSPYLIQQADYVGCHNAYYLHKYNILDNIKDNGIFLLNSQWDQKQILTHIPKKIKRQIADKNLQFYVIDAYKIAIEANLHRHINTVMIEAFFLITNLLNKQLATDELIESVKKTYSHKEEIMIEQNIKAILETNKALVKVDYPKDEWKNITIEEVKEKSTDNYMGQIANPILSGCGDNIALSTMKENNMVYGEMPLGTSKKEKIIPALSVPKWDMSKCTQCNECSFICPHAAIRPILLDEEENNNKPEGYITQDFKGQDGLYYRIQVAVDKCTGCSLCVDACPAGALKMVDYNKEKNQAINWAFSMTIKHKELNHKQISTKSTQFNQPLLEFSSACSGCGETPYVKLLTQMYGDRLMIANATGCSSIWGASSPTTPYTTNEKGQGPAWSNSLLEDAAEYGYGMYLANQMHRHKLATKMKQLLDKNIGSKELQELFKDFIDHIDDGEGSIQRSDKLKKQLQKDSLEYPQLQEVLKDQDIFVKPSQWIIGGDGWAYDIGYGGLDHILSTGANVNILVLDNEVYANTGGQKSKATPKAAIAKFTSTGKKEFKKDLGQMAMVYDNVYVAQVSANANSMQTIKAFDEAERFDGPSLIIAYTPCIAHGLQGGMKNANNEAKEAVESGYWALYRYNPFESKKMHLDYKKPKFEKIEEFLLKQNRFKSLKEQNEKQAKQLFEKIENNARKRFLVYAEKAGIADKFKQSLGDENSKQNLDEKELRRLRREQRRKEREKAKNIKKER